jgi:hypothetical protein
MEEDSFPITGYLDFFAAIYDSDKADKEESLGVSDGSSHDIWTRARFKLKDVMHWHEGTDGYVYVVFSNGSELKIKEGFEEFSGLMEIFDSLLYNPQLN